MGELKRCLRDARAERGRVVACRAGLVALEVVHREQSEVVLHREGAHRGRVRQAPGLPGVRGAYGVVDDALLDVRAHLRPRPVGTELDAGGLVKGLDLAGGVRSAVSAILDIVSPPIVSGAKFSAMTFTPAMATCALSIAVMTACLSAGKPVEEPDSVSQTVSGLPSLACACCTA